MDDISTKLFGGFILVMGAWMIQLGRKAARTQQRAVDWPTTQATITESEVRKKPGANAKFRFKIRYQYSVNGKQYTNNKISIGGEVSSGRTRAEKRQRQYPEGSRHLLRYNPDDANEAYLEPAVEGGGRIEVVGGVLGILLGALLVGGLIG